MSARPIKLAGIASAEIHAREVAFRLGAAEHHSPGFWALLRVSKRPDVWHYFGRHGRVSWCGFHARRKALTQCIDIALGCLPFPQGSPYASRLCLSCKRVERARHDVPVPP